MRFQIDVNTGPLPGRLTYTARSDFASFYVTTTSSDDGEVSRVKIEASDELIDELPVVNVNHLLGLFLVHLAAGTIPEIRNGAIPDFEVTK